MDQVELVILNNDNLEAEGCFCLRSKPNSVGYKNKNEWLMDRFNEGLSYIKLMENSKQVGFIESTPIEHSSRVVYGENYLVIHCLWVSVTGKGYASKLIQACIAHAKDQNKAGVVVVTNPDTSWTPSKDVFIKNGFQEIAQAPYSFELLVYTLERAPLPYFPNDWDERLHRFESLTILCTPQCPFIEVATDNVLLAANKIGIEAQFIDMKDREELMRLSPTPYGVYGVVYEQELVAYHRLTAHSALKRLKGLSRL